MTDAASQFAALIIAARRDLAARIAALPPALVPADRAAAYAVQHKVAAGFGGIGGWKVGAPGGETICGALPASGVQASPTKLAAATHPYRGIEAEEEAAVAAQALQARPLSTTAPRHRRARPRARIQVHASSSSSSSPSSSACALGLIAHERCARLSLASRKPRTRPFARQPQPQQHRLGPRVRSREPRAAADRKSTRLNSSH